MNWIQLESLKQLQDIKNAPGNSVIFKHSTRCSISMMARKRFELDQDEIPEGTPLYFLDLIKHRDVSGAIAEIFDVYHESPQVLVIKDGVCVYHASHGEISADLVSAHLS